MYQEMREMKMNHLPVVTTYDKRSADFEAYSKLEDRSEKDEFVLMGDVDLGFLCDISLGWESIEDDQNIVDSAEVRLTFEPRVLVSYFHPDGTEVHVFGVNEEGQPAYFITESDIEEMEEEEPGFYHDEPILERWFQNARAVTHSEPQRLCDVATKGISPTLWQLGGYRTPPR